MSARTRRSSGRSSRAVDPDDAADVVLPSPQPLRRTRSQTAREAAAAASPAASSTPPPVEEDDEEPIMRTPIKKRQSRANGSGSTASTPSSDLSSAATGSPSLRDRTSAAIDTVKNSCSRYQLLAIEHVPEWLKDNLHIRSGYRANIGWRHSVESVCHLHNETVNVWTHLIAFLLMTCVLIGTMMVLSPHGVDRLDLDVVLSSRPVCDTVAGGVGNPLCETAPIGSATAEAVDSDAPTDVTDDPMELLHQILGDKQDEMLVELLSRVQLHVPNMQQITQSLKEKASSIQSSLYASVPEDATRQLIQLKDDTSLTFGEYVTRMEEKLASLKSTISSMLPLDETSNKASAASLRVHEEYVKLKETLSEFSRDFSPDLLLFTAPRDLDVIQVTQSVVSKFLEQANWARHGFTLSPTMVAMPGVKVSVRSIVEGMALGTGGIFGAGYTDAMDELAPQTDALSVTDQLIEKQDHAATVVDADGRGKTTTTTIGYMTVEAHTSKSKPGQVQLQLHSYLPRYPLAIFIITAMMCLLFSSAYHLLHAVSEKWARRFQALDYAGIVLLIAGSTHPIIYYGFYCAPVLKWMYIGIVWSLALLVFFIVVLPSFRSPRFRGLKVSCFIALGFSGCVPLYHFNLDLDSVHFILYWLLVMGACYIVGAMIYLFQVPERWWPGHFDYFCSSHQLWHMSIFAAVLVHYFALMHMYEWRMAKTCPRMPMTLPFA